MPTQKLTHRIEFDAIARKGIAAGRAILITDTLKINEETGEIAREFSVRVEGDERTNQGKQTTTAEQEGGGQQRIPEEPSAN